MLLETRMLKSIVFRRGGGLMVSVLDSGANGPGSGPGRGHCVVFLGKTLYSHGVSLIRDTVQRLGPI